MRQPPSIEPWTTLRTSATGLAPRRGREADVVHEAVGHDQRDAQHRGAQEVRHAQVGHLGDDATQHRADQHRRAGHGLRPTEDGLEMRLRKPVALRASTSQASVAPEKNVNPSPSSADASAQPMNGAWTCHIT